MPPKRLGNDFKTIDIDCISGHKVARYRKPREEWGHRTRKLWLIEERIGRLRTEPPLLQWDDDARREVLQVPPSGTLINCGEHVCDLEIGVIEMVQGTVALKLNKGNLRPTKG